MGEGTTKQPTILLGLKRYRITITRKTLQMIGNPAHILLLVKPEEKTLVISHGSSIDKRAHRIPPLKPDAKRKREIELYSKPLMQSIASISAGLQYNSSYRIQGEIIPDENILRFYIDKAEIVSRGTSDA